MKIGSLDWTPGIDNSERPYFATSDPNEVTHRLQLTAGTKKVVLGFNRNGGGLMWSNKLYWFEGFPNGTQIGVGGYGRSMLGSIRSRLQHGMHNPIQSGRHYNIGVPVKVVQTASSVLVPQFRAPLWDDQEWPFRNHRSEFDFSALTTDISARCGIPAFSHEEYFVWARKPEAMLEFQSGIIPKGPYLGEPIIDPSVIISDISMRDGVQTPATFDYSFLVQTIKGLRPPIAFKWLHTRQNGQWVVQMFEDDGIASRAYIPTRDYYYQDGTKVHQGRRNLDMALHILSTDPDPDLGVAQGLFIPVLDPLNELQIKAIDTGTGQVFWEEDRRFNFMMAVSKEVSASYKGPAFLVNLARTNIAGMLSPDSATAVYNRPSVEAITNRSIVMYGTPTEIYNACVDGLWR